MRLRDRALQFAIHFNRFLALQRGWLFVGIVSLVAMAFSLCLSSTPATACYGSDPPGQCTPTNAESRIEGGWWTGSNVVGDGCNCTFDFSGISQDSGDTDLDIPEYWGNCSTPAPESSSPRLTSAGNENCTQLGWLDPTWIGDLCCAGTWYESADENGSSLWAISNIGAAPCVSQLSDSDGSCVDLAVKENGVGGASEFLQDGDSAYLTQFIYLPKPVVPDWRKAWKISFDTHCFLSDSDVNASDFTGFNPTGEACTDSTEGVKDAGDGPLVLELYCGGRPARGGGSGYIARYQVPPYATHQRFEAEFFLPDGVAPDDSGYNAYACQTDDETYMVALVLRVVNDRDPLFDEVAVDTPSPMNDLWRVTRIQDMRMDPIVTTDEQITKGLADYEYLYEYNQVTPVPADAVGVPVEGFVESCLTEEGALWDGLLYRTSEITTQGEADPTPYCESRYDWNSRATPMSLGNFPGDAPVFTEGGEEPTGAERGRPSGADPAAAWLRTRFAPLWYPGNGGGTVGTATRFFISKHPDLVFPWTIPTSEDIGRADEIVNVAVPVGRSTHVWLAVRNDSETDILFPLFTTSWSDAKIFEVLYMPVRVPSQNPAMGVDFDDQHRTSAYQLRGLLVRECESEAASGGRRCTMPLLAGTSRAYLLETPVSDQSNEYAILVSYYDGTNILKDSVPLRIQPICKMNPQGVCVKPEPELPIIPQWSQGPLHDEKEKKVDEFDAYFNYVKQHGVTHLHAGSSADASEIIPVYRTISDNPDFPGPDDGVSLFFRFGDLAGMKKFDKEDFGLDEDVDDLSFDGEPIEVSITIKDANGQDCDSQKVQAQDGQRIPCPYENNSVAVIKYTDGKPEPWAALEVGDYIACDTSSNHSDFARVGEKKASGADKYLVLDVPFPTGACLPDGSTAPTRRFYRVAFTGSVDGATLEGCYGALLEGSYWIDQSALCSETVDIACKPIACQDPDVEFALITEANLPRDTGTHGRASPDQTGPSTWQVVLTCDRKLRLNADGEFRCWIAPDRLYEQKAQLLTIRNNLLLFYNGQGAEEGDDRGGSLGPEPLLNFTGYDEAKSWSSVRGEFDGFGQGEFPMLLRFFQLQCDTPNGLIPSCKTDPPSGYSEGVFPPTAMNSTTKEFLYYFRRLAEVLDTDRDGFRDARDPFPYCGDNRRVCNPTEPIFKSTLAPYTSKYADDTVAQLIPSHRHEFDYDANYRWAFWQPMEVRMRGHMWRKVADEHLEQGGHPDLSLPNLILYPGRFLPTDALGTWDTLPINGGPYATQSDRELPVFLTDPFGRYGSIDGEIWQYPMETVTLLTLPDQITDAFMAIISGAELSDTDVAVPYGQEYSVRNGSLGKGVCYAQELTSAYATRVLETGGGILSYSDVVAACSTD